MISIEGIRVESSKTDALAKIVCTAIPYWPSKIFGNGKLSRQIYSKSCWSFRTFPSAFEKERCFWFAKTPVRCYWKVENFDTSSLILSKNCRSKLTGKIKNRCKFWRIRSTPQTKPCLVRKPTMASNRIFVPRFTWLRETKCPNWKIDSLCSFWSRTFPRIFLWS